jgi:GalNAc-alpha-(1->4)-GalNAc-alpha-(1->3)-diNAcBac-PP-undecaprenol alpha-1,4-N-acetyl-D-galactosaminyltransferase
LVNHILLVISSLSLGGAQRVLTHMANYWVGEGIKVSLISFENDSAHPLYSLSPEVTHIPLDIKGYSPNRLMGIWNNFKRISILRKGIKNSHPDIVISFLDITNVLALIATRGLNVPVIAMELSDPVMVPLRLIWKKLRLWTYPWASQVGVLHKKAQDYFPTNIQRKTTIIPNPILLEKLESDNEKPLKGPTVVSMGRLSEEKRLDNLLMAFAILKDKYLDWNLTIIGEGSLRNELELLRDKLDLIRRVEFMGIVKNPHSLISKADLFVLPSRFEGFPMALCEAMACGLAVISTEYHGGVREIIDEGVNGVLVPREDVNALAAAMDTLMGDDAERKRLGTKAIDIQNKFGLERIMGIWKELIERVLLERKR